MIGYFNYLERWQYYIALRIRIMQIMTNCIKFYTLICEIVSRKKSFVTCTKFTEKIVSSCWFDRANVLQAKRLY